MKQNKQEKQEKFQKRLIHFIADTASPLSIVERKSFIDLFTDSSLRVPSRPTIKKELSCCYERMIKTIKKDIAANNFFCTTADIWSGKHRSFFGYTCHWLNDKFERVSVALACRRLAGSHSFEKIDHMIKNINIQFNLNENNIIRVVTDNGSNFIKAFKEFGLTFEPSENDTEEESNAIQLEDDEDIGMNNECLTPLPKHLRCASHTLNLLATTDYIKIIKKDNKIFDKHSQVCTYIQKISKE